MSIAMAFVLVGIVFLVIGVILCLVSFGFKKDKAMEETLSAVGAFLFVAGVILLAVGCLVGAWPTIWSAIGPFIEAKLSVPK